MPSMCESPREEYVPMISSISLSFPSLYGERKMAAIESLAPQRFGISGTHWSIFRMSGYSKHKLREKERLGYLL